MKKKPSDFTAAYARLVERHLGRKPRPADGLSDAAIRRREKGLGVKLPASLRAYYHAAGKLTELNRKHNLLYDMKDLVVEDGYLVFMEENQAVVHWCFRLADLGEPDPEVWQRVNGEPPEWHSEEMPFSTFIARMFDWQAGFDDSATRSRSGKASGVSKRERALTAIRRVLAADWNPLGPDAAPDEYDSYAGSVYRLLERGADRHRLADHLLRLETASMGLRGDRDRCAGAARKLVEIGA